MAKIPINEKMLKSMVGENPEPVILHVSSNLFKAGYVNIEIPKKLLKVGNIHVSVRVPKTELVDETKRGKIGSYGIQELPDGKIRDIPILKTMFSKYTNIDLFVSNE